MKYLGPKIYGKNKGGMRVIAVVMWIILIGIILKGIIFLFSKYF